MRRAIQIRVDEKALRRLGDLAVRERRRPADQAAIIIEAALGDSPQSSDTSLWVSPDTPAPRRAVAS